MAGSVMVEYEDGYFIVKMYGGDDRLVDVYEVDYGKLNFTREAALAISDDVLAHLNAAS